MDYITELVAIASEYGGIIGAGSVITRDIPANVVAAGVPCKVIREIREDEKTDYFEILKTLY